MWVCIYKTTQPGICMHVKRERKKRKTSRRLVYFRCPGLEREVGEKSQIEAASQITTGVCAGALDDALSFSSADKTNTNLKLQHYEIYRRVWRLLPIQPTFPKISSQRSSLYSAVQVSGGKQRYTSRRDTHLAVFSVHAPTIGPTSHTIGRPEEEARPYRSQLLMSTAPSPPAAGGPLAVPFPVPVTTLIVVLISSACFLGLVPDTANADVDGFGWERSVRCPRSRFSCVFAVVVWGVVRI